MMIRMEDVLRYLDSQKIQYKYSGEGNFAFSEWCPLNNLKRNSITWVRNIDDVRIDELNATEGIVLVAEYDQELKDAEIPVIYAVNAHKTFFKIVSEFFRDRDPEERKPGISSTAVIETMKVGKDVYVGHHVYIGPDVEIGDYAVILNNVTIQGRTVIGKYTVIESGTTIGACGFGHYQEDGKPYCVPHLGGVTIGNHVKIGANNAISRGCLADTIIEDYVKTDNLCHIAHNAHIKTGAMLTACVEISGSATIGENVWLGPGTTVNNGIVIGNGSYTGLGAAITRSQPDNKVIVGIPGKVLRDRKPGE